MTDIIIKNPKPIEANRPPPATETIQTVNLLEALKEKTKTDNISESDI